MRKAHIPPGAPSMIRRWACIVGINQYTHIARPLQFCINDASDLHDLLINSSGSGYDRGRMILLLGETNASPETQRLNILSQLEEMASQTQPEDMLLFYFAGHAQTAGHDGGEVYLLATDTQANALMPETAVSLTSVTRILDASPAHTKVIILDACYTGAPLRAGLARRSPLTEPDSDLMAELLRESEGTAILSSAARSDAAFEAEDLRHGVFTYFLLQGLSGAANPRADGGITVNEIHKYTSEQVRKWAKQHKHAMRPTMEFRGSGELTLISTPFVSDTVTAPAPTALSATAAFSPDAWLAPLRQPWPGWIGRDMELKRIKELIFTTTDLAIRIKGDPGVGKTSFLNRIKYEIEEDTSQAPRRFRCLSISTGRLETCEGFAHELRDGLNQFVDSDHTEISQQPFQLTTFGAFGAQIDRIRLAASDTTFVVILDELDRIMTQCSDLEQRRITDLMSYLINNTAFPIVFLFTVVRDIPGHFISPFTMDALTLHVLDREETRRLMRELLRPYVVPTAAELDQVFDYTGGHPYLTRLLAAKLFDSGPWDGAVQGIGQERLDHAMGAVLASDRTLLLLKGVYTSLLNDDQRQILLRMACDQRPVIILNAIERRLRSAVKELAQREILSELRAEGADGAYGPRVRVMTAWLRQWLDFAAEVDRLGVPCDHLYAQETATRPPDEGIPSGGIFIDRTRQRVYVAGREVNLPFTDLQFRALVYMARRVGEVITYDELAREIWADEYYDQEEGMSDQRISTLISRLRYLLNDREKPYIYLTTLPKRGYRLTNAKLAN